MLASGCACCRCCGWQPWNPKIDVTPFSCAETAILLGELSSKATTNGRTADRSTMRRGWQLQLSSLSEAKTFNAAFSSALRSRPQRCIPVLFGQRFLYKPSKHCVLASDLRAGLWEAQLSARDGFPPALGIDRQLPLAVRGSISWKLAAINQGGVWPPMRNRRNRGSIGDRNEPLYAITTCAK